VLLFIAGHLASRARTAPDEADESVIPAKSKESFSVRKSPLPAEVIRKMKKYSWRKGCPVGLGSLTYLRLKHWGYDGKIHDGELVVHEEVADDITAVFRALFEARFPIEKMRLVDDYDGSDERSMADNNTSAFNCRLTTGSRRVFSRHSWGKAIDINPVANPYVRKKTVSPPAGKEYLDRAIPRKGMILRGGVVHKEFTKRGWRWGGSWKRLKDYQHFEKRRRSTKPK
jgi:hypothetical protein